MDKESASMMHDIKNDPPMRTLITAFAIQGILQVEKSVTQTASKLIRNLLSSIIHQNEDENTFEEWCFEILISLGGALERENEVDTCNLDKFQNQKNNY